MNYYRRYSGDYLRDTMRMTLTEHGAYCLLLDYYCSEEIPFPADYGLCYNVCSARRRNDRAAVRKVTDQFFPIGDDGLRHNARADKEILKAKNGYGLIGYLRKLPPHVRNGIQARRRANLKNAVPAWLTHGQMAEINTLYLRSRRLTETTGIQHEVDHIVPLTHEAVCGLHVPWNLQVITGAANSKKSNRFAD